MAEPRFLSRLLILTCAFLGLRATAQPVLFSPPKSPRIANYDIAVRLDIRTHRLHGREILRWRNTAAMPLSELQFHLYLNGFRNSHSTYMRESGKGGRASHDAEEWGYIEVDSLTSAAGENWLPLTSFIQPDDGNPEDKSVLRLQLPRPLPPGETLTLHLAFTAQLPAPPVARTGIKEEFVMAGQWFPKIGVCENGTWNCHQFHANSEFFADFGVYNVDITVPRGHIVGATGLEFAVQDNADSTITHRYHAEDVHDFAWTSSPDFVVFTGRSRGVAISALVQKDHARQGARYIKAAETAVAWFHDQYGEYPYSHLTVVDPRRGAMATGGMEYPTLITAWGAYSMPAGLHPLEMVIMHEFGHNYWYHLVASNEFEEAWLDEGINTFSEIGILADTYGESGSMVDFWGLKLGDTQLQRLGYISQPGLDPVLLPSWQYASNASYSSMSYNKPGLVLLTLQNYLGRETMNRILRTWLARWQFKHPHTSDFIAVANEVSGQNLDWFFDQALNTTAVLDYSVSRVSSEKVSKGRGFDLDLDIPTSATTVPGTGQAAQDSSALAADTTGVPAISPAPGEAKGTVFETRVEVRRLGDFIFPVEVEMIFAGGDTVRENW
ncbi:MAG TPA: M1 family metallopeptidase, partial [bacterium]|nr:M1 family metallopeptidase [bacterium]